MEEKTTMNCRGRLVDLSEPMVMGILNLTPDSFFDGGQYGSSDQMKTQAEKMLREGAAIIDVGGMSSRPGAEQISVEEELKRVISPIKMLTKAFPEALVSIDTVHSKVALEAYNEGASIINDISAGTFDPEMLATAGKIGLPYILMHMQGTPATMQTNPEYEDVVIEVFDFLSQKVDECRKNGIKDIILDPGFGFGKTIEQNYKLLKNMNAFRILDLPILAGLSRKSMIHKVLKSNPEEALNGSSALHMIALQQGAKILRVHDVKPAQEVIKLWQQLGRV